MTEKPFARDSRRDAFAGGALETLAAKLDAATPSDEAALVAEAARLLLPDDDAALAFCRGHAFADAALTLHRKALPFHGFQFGDLAFGKRGLASNWRAGDASAMPFEAATPALALLRAAVRVRLRECETEARLRCVHCRGRGWRLMRDGEKRICRHGH